MFEGAKTRVCCSTPTCDIYIIENKIHQQRKLPEARCVARARYISDVVCCLYIRELRERDLLLGLLIILCNHASSSRRFSRGKCRTRFFFSLIRSDALNAIGIRLLSFGM